MSFSKKIKKGQQRSKSAKKGQKSQISEFMKRTQITHQNEALSVSRSEKLVLKSKRSLKVKKAQKKKKNP